MVKHKSVKEMMAMRQPLARKPVEPVNIYSAQPQTVTIKLKPAETAPQKPQPALKKVVAVTHDETEPLRPYSTYLHKAQVKGIKLRAVERDINDMEVVQEAIDEYFKN